MDKSEHNSQDIKIETAEQNSLSIAADCPPNPPEKEKKRSIGNIIYDFPVFGGIAWGGVAALSAISAHESMFGKNKYFAWLRTLNDVVYKGVKSGLSKTIMKNSPEELVDGYAKGTTMFATLGMGGNALMAPLKWMEDNRQKNAARIDNLLGTTPPDPELVQNEPKQTWGSVLKGRLISWGGSFAAFLLMGPKLTGKINDAVGERATEIFMKWKPEANKASVGKWSNIAAFDALFTVITASATYVFSRFFATREEEKHHLADELFELNTANPHAITKILDDKKSEKDDFVAKEKPSQKFAEKHKSKRDSLPISPVSLLDRASAQPEFAHSL